MNWVDIPKYGSVIKIENFIDCIKQGAFISSDGFGNYAMADKMENDMEVDFSEREIREMITKHGFTHVIWFNK